MFVWTRETIQYRMDAWEYLQYDAEIAAHILPFLPKEARVCDAGCGLGCLSLALAPHCGRVTAVDSDAAALEVLRRNAQKAEINNLEIVWGNLFAMRPKPLYDAMIFCFFGQLKETLRAAKRQCGGRIILIKKNWENHRFTLEKSPLRHSTYSETLRELEALGVPCVGETFPLEMGQPFRSAGDAAAFFSIYSGASADAAEVLPLLEETGNSEFPYFLSSCRQLGLIVLDTGKIPDSI